MSVRTSEINYELVNASKQIRLLSEELKPFIANSSRGKYTPEIDSLEPFNKTIDLIKKVQSTFQRISKNPKRVSGDFLQTYLERYHATNNALIETLTSVLHINEQILDRIKQDAPYLFDEEADTPIDPGNVSKFVHSFLVTSNIAGELFNCITTSGMTEWGLISEFNRQVSEPQTIATTLGPRFKEFERMHQSYLLIERGPAPLLDECINNKTLPDENFFTLFANHVYTDDEIEKLKQIQERCYRKGYMLVKKGKENTFETCNKKLKEVLSNYGVDFSEQERQWEKLQRVKSNQA
jgi:hypothetical protein